jgi:hypothetical protein
MTSSCFRHNYTPGRLGIGLDKSPEHDARATGGIPSNNPRREDIPQARQNTSATVTGSDFPGIPAPRQTQNDIRERRLNNSAISAALPTQSA